MKTLLRFAFLLFGAAATQGSSPAAASEQVVDVELVLAVDVSLSMMPFELEIQRKGYAAAITDPSVVGAIRQGLHGRIAVTYIEWAGDYTQRQVVPWTMIETAEDARAFASTLTANAGGGMRRTSISGAIAYSAGLFDDNGFRGLKRVIDISGDGPNNQGRPVTEARDDAVDRGIIINGLPLMTLDSSPYGSFDIPDLDRYYTRCVIGGPGAFMVPVDGWEQFPEAIRRKLVLELAGVQRSPVIRVAGPALEDTEPYDCLIGERIWQRRFQLYQEN
ncbi:hypothetical protein CSC94_07350 [Zhengella mangrovi]|uniref:DUF1194 domain-containing protein n=1 Tax=Zhengella mangrovi TaxID=1982044 RepID=A0A2G1QPX0_9HYPH|nr:DUF1194 domain-containing protein [Zhengella mangrovi]PHP67514.1 hypothetical protein CSC94_07350 [Zhengella mangrovi]